MMRLKSCPVTTKHRSLLHNDIASPVYLFFSDCYTTVLFGCVHVVGKGQISGTFLESRELRISGRQVLPRNGYSMLRVCEFSVDKDPVQGSVAL